MSIMTAQMSVSADGYYAGPEHADTQNSTAGGRDGAPPPPHRPGRRQAARDGAVRCSAPSSFRRNCPV
jgi:hypothetical protein